jgi:sigma-B regulation protein RsbU (phosphoserine phosphatase)
MRVLVVDDESYIRDLLIETLQPLGLDVAAAADGREALRMLEQVRPNLMILDVAMPEMDGYEVLRRLRPSESFSRIFVLMLTARGEIEDLEKGLDSGADDYLIKPFHLRELVARVKAAIRVQSLQEELLVKNHLLEESNETLAVTLKAQERLNRVFMLEMEVAARLQNGIFSPGSLDLGRMRAAARYQPSTKIGGDLYDLRSLGDSRAAIFLADAVGHGVSAALLAAMAKTALEGALAGHSKPSEVLGSLNRSFQFCSEHGKYLTAFFGVLDCETGQLVYSLAGHMPPLLYRDSKRCIEKLDSPGFCLGIFEEGRYEDREMILYPGDRLFAYTDGIYDASRDDRHLFGTCFPGMLMENAGASNEDLLDRLDAGLMEFLGGARPSDDYTLVAVHMLKESGRTSSTGTSGGRARMILPPMQRGSGFSRIVKPTTRLPG